MTQATSKLPLTPVGLFAAVPTGHSNPLLKFSRFPSRAAVEYVLRRSVSHLRLNSPYQLGQLLGCSYTSQIYNWFNGTRRPASLILTRLLFLYDMRSRGAKLCFMSRINWDTGVIKWRKGLGPGARTETPFYDLRK